MEKIDVTSTVFYYVAKNLSDELLGGYINNIQTLDENTFKIKVHKQKTKQLIINNNVCFLSDYLLPTIENNGFGVFLKKALVNQRIHEIKQDKNNRVIYFKLDKHYLIFEFFSNSNIILTDINFKIITSKQKEEWKDRIIKKGEIYKFPINYNIREYTENEIISEIERTTQKTFEQIGRTELISYLVRIYKLPPSDMESIIDEQKISKKTITKIKKLYEYKKPKLVFVDWKTNKTLTVINEEGFIYDDVEKHYLESYKRNAVKSDVIKQSKNEIILKEQIETKNAFEEKIKTFNKEGETIYAYFPQIDQINQQIKLATSKKINETEIINKINDYLNKNNLGIKIININQKNKTYIAEFK